MTVETIKQTKEFKYLKDIDNNMGENKCSQDNRIVQYILVRRDLVDKLGEGVLATQVSHASLAPITKQLRGNSNEVLENVLDKETKRWVEGSFVKLVLEVPDKSKLTEIMQRLYADGIKYEKIQESTLDGELTCIGLKPYDKGRVAPYFKGLPLLGSNKKYTNRISAFVDNEITDTSKVGYSVLDINQREHEKNGSRFILQVDMDYLIKRYGPQFNNTMKEFREHGGTGNDFIDSLEDCSLELNLRENNREFNHYLLEDRYDSLLDTLLKKGEKTITITSLDGIFTNSSEVYIYGGCHKF